MTDENQQYPFGIEANPARQKPPAKPPKPARKSIFIYAAILAVIGVLAGITFAAMPWLFGNAKGRNDLGLVVSSPDGLNGHLYLEWNGQLEYRLRLEPGDQSQLDGFSLTVSRLSHPVDFYIQLFDSENHALCGMHILMKLDSGIGDESEPEHGNNMLQKIYGPSGQIVAIHSQGAMPCPKSAWVKAASWSFLSNFPTLDEQRALESGKQQSIADAARSAAEEAARKRDKLRASQNLAAFSIEGDDAIVEYDVARGIIQTKFGKTFFVKKSGGEIDSGWQDFPVSIHYKCDRSSTCELMHAGAGALRARMSR
jgi:hypothetical protein